MILSFLIVEYKYIVSKESKLKKRQVDDEESKKNCCRVRCF